MPKTSSLLVNGLSGETDLNIGTITTSSHRLTSIAFTLENLSYQPITTRLHVSKPLDDTFTITAVQELIGDRSRSTQTVLPDPSAALNRNHVLDYPEDDAILTLFPESRNIFQAALLGVSVQRSPTSTSQSTQRVLCHKPFHGSIIFQDVNSSVQLATLSFHGTFCESWIQPDLTLLDFGHCAVSVWVYRDIAIRNLSALPARCCISHSIRPALEPGNVTELRFSDPVTGYETDPKLICVEPLAEHGVRIAFRATAPVDRDNWLCLQNLDNAEDFWHIHVVAKVGTARIAQKVFVSCGSELSFGDCYAHFQTFRDIVVQSNYKEDVMLALKTDRPKRVSFEVLNEWFVEDISDADAKRTKSRTYIENDMFDVSSNQSFETESDKRKTPGQNATSSDPEFASSGSKSVDRQKVAKKPSKFPESVILRPGQKKGVRVWYLPMTMPKDRRRDSRNIADLDPGKLCDESFQMSFELSSGETRRVVAQSRVCESILRLERNEVHLGNCNVMTKYRTMLSVINCSDLPAFVSINYVSQCVSVDAHEFQILPRQGYDLGLEFIPRQVNPGYHKEMTISNLRNPKASNLLFTLKADCVDDQGISMHALFYKLLAPKVTNEIDFGVTVANHPAIRAVKIRNITKKRLILKFGECAGVTTYLPSVATLRSDASASKSDRYQQNNLMPKCLCQRKPRSVFLGTKSSICETTSSATARALVDMDITRTHQDPSSKHKQSLPVWDFEASFASLQRYRNPDGSDAADNAEYDSLSVKDKSPQMRQSENQVCWVECFSSQSEGKASMLDSMPTFFSNHDSEMRYTEQQFRQEHSLNAAILAGCLTASETLVLEPKAESVVVLCFRPSDKDVRGKTKIRPIERHVSVSMVDFDRSRLVDLPEATSKQMYHMAKLFGEGEASRPREVMLTVQACKSRMSIAPLRQLNFGSIACGEQKDKAFTIVNLSEAPLLYEIRKTNSGLRDDIRFNLGKGTRGVVRPYFTRVVPFIFAPSTEGRFEEQIVIENRLDQTASSVLVVKAHIRPKSCVVRHEDVE